MECVSNIYFWNKKDITFFNCYKIAQILDLLTPKENRDFDEIYADFLESNTYRAIQDTRSLLWYENAEFIMDEYCREKLPPAEEQAGV
jgi:hypothetical protein